MGSSPRQGLPLLLWAHMNMMASVGCGLDSLRPGLQISYLPVLTHISAESQW